MRLFNASPRSVVGCAAVGDELIIADVRVSERPGVQSIHRVDHPGTDPAALRSLARSFRLHNKPWVWAIPEDSYQLLLVDVPDVAEEDVKSALQLKVKDLISFPLSEASVDILFLPDKAFRGRNRMAFAVVAHHDNTVAVENLFGTAGLVLQQITVADLAYRNLLQLVRQSATAALLTMRSEESALIASYEEDLCLERSLSIGQHDLVTREADPGTDGQADTSESTGYDFDLELSPDDLAQPGDNHADDPLASQLDALGLELQRSFDYFDSQLGLGSIAELHILSGRALPDQVFDTMNDRFNVQTRPLALHDYLDLGANVAPSDLTEAAAAIGATLSGSLEGAHAAR